MTTQYGITPTGFRPMSLTEVTDGLGSDLQSGIGTSINLAPESVFGQLVAIFGERIALLWQLGQSLSNAYNPANASGLAVDNILALNNLSRLNARPTVTAPQPVTSSQGVTQYGIVLYGTPGTVIPAGALVSNSQAIPVQFALDSAVTIGAAVCARQTISFSNTPSSGAYKLTLFDGQGTSLTTASIAYNATASDVQAACRALQRSSDSLYPFTDLSVTSSPNGLVFDFGAVTPADGQPSSANQSIPLLAIASSTLQQSGSGTNLTVSEARVGAPAQGTGSATATVSGPNTVLAGDLSVIVTPQMGWSGVTNQLDCITGADTETDAEALNRFNELRGSQGSGTLAAVADRVRQVTNVSSVTAFQNVTNAAQQSLTFTATPQSGSYQLATAQGTTTTLAYNAAANDVRSALAAIPGYAPVKVSGTPAYGFTIDFNGSQGGQAVPLLNVLNNSTGVGLQVAFGRPPHAIELVVSGGADADIAAAINAAMPAGFTSYGAPVLVTTASVQAQSTQLTVASALNAAVGLTVSMSAVPIGTQVASINGNVITLSQPAIASVSGATCLLQHAPLLADSAGNGQLIGFSRPVPTLLYVSISLTTDQYLTPGDKTSGLNAAAKWSPSSIATIQSNLLAIGNSIGVGGLIVARGTNGLLGCFNQTPGITDYKLMFGTSANPTNTDAIQLQPNQAPVFEQANIAVSYV